ncbi:hypothetical protein [Wenjunlia tyrosinilytica]|uniref:hypothetical protein n=1 Tax=Wenjunlia tyrosinilytica TaxID=1544741 RepID=UPI001666461C|nr:hypothetical protein [Wenjunlia tyrosinilytica]
MNEVHDRLDLPVQGAGIVCFGRLQHDHRHQRRIVAEPVDQPLQQVEDRVCRLDLRRTTPDLRCHTTPR